MPSNIPARRRHSRAFFEFRLWGLCQQRVAHTRIALAPAEGGLRGGGLNFLRGGCAHRPVGRIHWAGTETADAWTGYIDGAIRSGARAIKDVSTRL
ncbi:MAG: FAD-dependent oxidoreductase [Caulobacteraceae bacterium]